MVIRTFEDYIILQYDLVERGGKMKKTLIIIAVLVLLFSGCAVLNSSVDKSNEDVSFSVSKSTTKENAASQHIESNTSANIVKTELDTTNANTTSQSNMSLGNVITARIITVIILKTNLMR